jgi:nucleotide-binding universal stress UspA family protein
MYKHILIPTDGSELSERAVEAGIALASFLHARVTGFTAVPEYQLPPEAEIASKHERSAAQGYSLADHEREVARQAAQALQRIAEHARAAGVEYDEEFTQCDRPHEAIIRAAREHGCDLIFMASHGRRGLSALLHGSQTQGVLTHSTIPALVYRQ